MPKDYKPPREAADTFASYKAAYESERELKPDMLEAADRELKAGATVGQLAAWTGLTPEVFRRRARALGVERKRAPTVGRLAAPTADMPTGAEPRARVSAALPPESDAETSCAAALPEMSPREAHKAIKRALSRAKPDQRERLNLTATTAGQLGRNKDAEVLKAASEMGLLKHDEVYAEPEPPATSEEQSA